jgi:hypothetical protein
VNKKKGERLQALHEAWVERLDAVGAVADRGSLWVLWADAPLLRSDEVRHLWEHLVHQLTDKERKQ